jgi:hypothetical protein
MSADVIALRPRQSEPSLGPIMALTAEGMNSVNAVILDKMQSRIPLIPALAGHLIAGGGKRMRPMLTSQARRSAIIKVRGITGSQRRSSSFTPRRCCMTMSSMAQTCGAARRPPTSFSAIPQPFWSAIFCSLARSS